MSALMLEEFLHDTTDRLHFHATIDSVHPNQIDAHMMLLLCGLVQALREL